MAVLTASALLCVCYIIVTTVCLAPGQAQTIPDEDWGYVDVRTDAHMFWWLYGAQATQRDSLPLIMWLQGGPGGSGTGFGNFEELGPLDVELQPREYTWVKVANVLFVDNPVGTGFSYVDAPSAYTTDVTQIANDLVTFFQAFLKKYPSLEDNAFYIFCESYGGKMNAAFAVALQKAIQQGVLKSNFKGVALGDSWISPVDSVYSWGPYLLSILAIRYKARRWNLSPKWSLPKRASLPLSLSLLNEEGNSRMLSVSDKIMNAMNTGQYEQATQLWGEAENIVEELADDVSFYNILLHHGNPKVLNFTSDDMVTGVGPRDYWKKLAQRHLGVTQNDPLSELMNGPIRKKLGVIPPNVTWGGQSGDVFFYQRVDFMKNVTADVDALLESGLTVVVYSGQLDLICATPGTLAWVDRLKWSGLPAFKKAARSPLYPPSGEADKNTAAFLQKYQNFHFYWILDAGHMVPKDNGEMALEMVSQIIQG